MSAEYKITTESRFAGFQLAGGSRTVTSPLPFLVTVKPSVAWSNTAVE